MEKNKLKSKHSLSVQKEIIKKLELKSADIANRINKKLNKKVSFHQQQKSEINFTHKKRIRMKTSKQPDHRKKKNRQNHIRNKKKKKNEKMKEMIAKIKSENLVVNLSNEEIPDITYIFLAKGLGFVPSMKVDIQDLRYDTLEFIRKLEWKAFFHQIKKDGAENTKERPPVQHNDIRISSFSDAPFKHPIMEDLKVKLLGWIANHKPKTPKSNLTECEIWGKKWLEDKIREKSIFVTKADKGESILIMNYTDVEEAIKKEIFDENKFEELQTNADDHIFTVRNKVNIATIDL